MRKLLPILLSFTALTLVGCSSSSQILEKAPAPSTQVEAETKVDQENIQFTYSLMSDETTKNEIHELMLANNIPLENVEAFFTSLDQFNELMGDMKGNTNGFETVSFPAELFDYDYIGTTWFNTLNFDDQQCRLTAFNLLKDTISIPNEVILSDPNHSLSGDLEIEKTNPNVNFTPDELTRFQTLYVDIPTNGETDPELLASIIGQEWYHRQIAFDEPNSAALMSVFLNSTETKSIFVGHAGIVLESEDGYVLVEKLGQYSPYLASKFSTLEDMKLYLLACYEPYVSATGSEPLIFINEQWLQ